MFKRKIIILLFICKINLTANEIKITVSTVGDILPHDNLQWYALATDKGFKTLFDKTKKIFISDDLSIANLESPINDNIPISNVPNLNAKSALIDAIKDSGIELLSLANNHSNDQGETGIISTLKCIKEKGLYSSGSGLTPKESKRPIIITIKDIKIGYISITDFSNNKFKEIENKPSINIIPVDDKNKIAAFCEVLKETKKKVDILIVSYHCGEEYKPEPNSAQINAIIQFAESGADVIIGHHPHVLQKIEFYRTKDERKVLIAYSLGNYISAQARIIPKLTKSNSWIYDAVFTKTAEGIILQFDVIKSEKRAYIFSPRIIPIFNLAFDYKKNNYIFNGYQVRTIEDILKMNRNESFFENINDIKKIVKYRLEKIKKTIGLPVVSSM